MFMFLVPTAVATTLLLTTVLLFIYRECTPDLSDVHPKWVAEGLGFVVTISSLAMSLGIGIKLANYLFG